MADDGARGSPRSPGDSSDRQDAVTHIAAVDRLSERAVQQMPEASTTVTAMTSSDLVGGRSTWVDDDLPRIAEEYRQFRAKYPEPGHTANTP